MYRSISVLMFSLCTLTITGHSADVTKQVYLISKEKLKCLYKQTDSLLNEPGDPVIVLLKNQCTGPTTQLVSGERGTLPILNLKIGTNVTLKPEDVLVLTHTQLKCFKLTFAQIVSYAKELVPVQFTDTCNSKDSYP